MKTPLLVLVLLAAACQRSETQGNPPAPARASASVAQPAAPPAPPAPPLPELERPYNVLLLMIDSLRADMPWAGYARDVAPRLTAFQREHCATYPNGYSLSSYTAKSVAPALVGEYPSAMPRTAGFFTQYPDPGNLFVSERVQQAGHRTLAGHAHGYFLPVLGNNQGFADYRLIPGAVDLKAVTSITSEPLTRLARDMLSTASNIDRPFFAYFHYLDPHHTYEKHKGHPDFGSRPRDVYDNEVHYTDHWVGSLLDWVREQPWGKRTAVIVTADHGEGFGERGHFRHAYEIWESLVRVPLFVCVPGVPPRRIEERRSHIDLAPTILDLMGVRAEPPLRGTSLLPEVIGAEPPRARRVVIDLPRSDLMDRRRAVIDGDWKLVAFGDDTSFKLFDLKSDPFEADDLAQKLPERLAQMKAIYREESAKIPVVPVVGPGALKGAPPGQRY